MKIKRVKKSRHTALIILVVLGIGTVIATISYNIGADRENKRLTDIRRKRSKERLAYKHDLYNLMEEEYPDPVFEDYADDEMLEFYGEKTVSTKKDGENKWLD